MPHKYFQQTAELYGSLFWKSGNRLRRNTLLLRFINK